MKTIGLTLAVLCLAAAALSSAQLRHRVTKAEVDRDMKELSNWGRWGKTISLVPITWLPMACGNRHCLK